MIFKKKVGSGKVMLFSRELTGQWVMISCLLISHLEHNITKRKTGLLHYLMKHNWEKGTGESDQ